MVAALGAARTFEAYSGLRLVEFNPVSYPPLAHQARIAGSVTVRAAINPFGEIADASALSGHPLLSQAALNHIKSLKFAPLAGGAVEIEITYVFTLLEEGKGHAGSSLDTAGEIRVFAVPPILSTTAAEKTR